MSSEIMAPTYPTTKIPLIPVSAFELPVPGQVDTVSIPKEFFPSFDAKNYGKFDWILISACSTQDTSPWEAYQQAVLPLHNDPAGNDFNSKLSDPSKPFLPIGVLCKLVYPLSQKEVRPPRTIDEDVFIDVLPVKRASIVDLKLFNNSSNSNVLSVYADILLVDERFLPSEEEFAHECSSLLDVFLKMIMGLDDSDEVDRIIQAGKLTGKSEIIDEEKKLIDKMNMLADFLVLSSEHKVLYLQSDDNIERLNIVVSAAKDYLLEYRHWQNAEHNCFKKIKKPVSTTALADQLDSLKLKGTPFAFPENIVDPWDAPDDPASWEDPPKTEFVKIKFKTGTGRKRIKKGKQTKLNLSDQVMSLDLPPEAKSQLKREVNKLNKLNPTSLEHSVLTDYLEWVCEIPWGTYGYVGDFNISQLNSSLNETHYGLENVKDHVVEHLAIEKLRGSSKGSVLCFVGPPGTGKTSIAKQIAKVTNRQLVKIALGGMSDESEIRGHRRTYVASRPGRFALGLKNSGTMDPLFLLDECDKINSSNRGDPTAALLEVLDPEQNDSFIDRYLEIPVDLSKASFICTANYLDQIPPALRDRMEFIYFREYTKEERIEITHSHLVDKCISEYNLSEYNVSFTDEVIEKICETTQVRQIERDIKKILRMSAVIILTESKNTIKIDLEFLKKSKSSENNKDMKSKKIGFGF